MLPQGSIANRHGHTLSLAQPPSYQPSTFDSLPHEQIPTGSFHTPLSPAPRPTITIPQSKLSIAPSNSGPQNSLANPALSAVLPRTRIDFARGFGLETPEEVEEEEEEKSQPLEPQEEAKAERTDRIESEEIAVKVDDETAHSLDAATTTTAPRTRIHSRHESKMSTSLSVPSRIRTPVVADVTTDLEMDAGEWTGSEDLYPSESSDNEVCVDDGMPRFRVPY